MQVECLNENVRQIKCTAKKRSKGSILQYFRASLSYHLSLRSLFCLFLSGCLRQVLLNRENINGSILILL